VYRINLYREYAEKQARARRRRLGTAGLTLLVAVEIALIVSLVLGGFLLREQNRNLQSDVNRLTAQLARASEKPPGYGTAEQLLTLRRQRCEWSPKLAALSCNMDPSLTLIELNGQTPRKGGRVKLELTGLGRTGHPELDALTRFTSALRNDAAMAEDFSEVTLETVEGGASGRFRVVCQAAEKPQ